MNTAIIIGGGLHGLSTALHLAHLPGWRVTVLERRHVGRHSSGINAGGVRRLGRDLAEVGLSMVAAEMWADMAKLVGDDGGFRPTGQVKLAESDADMAALARRRDAMLARGWTHEELIDAAETRRLLPNVAPHIKGALVVRDDGSANPMRTVMAFRRAVLEAGATIIEGISVTGIGPGLVVETDRGPMRADRVANCAGAWASGLAAAIGEPIPTTPKASMMIVTERLPRFCEPTVGSQSRALSFKQTDEGTVVIGGGHQGSNDLGAETASVDFSNLAHAARIAGEIFPLVRGAKIIRSWTGIEARTPDQVPVLGESRALPGLFHSFGYSGHGFQLSPAAGAAMAELMARGATNLPIDGLSPHRFAA